MSHCAPCLASTTSLLCADAIQQVASSPQMPITPNRCAFYLLKVTPNGFIRIELFASFSDLSISRNLHVLREAEPRRLRLHFKICDASARPPPLGKAPLLLLKEEEEGKNTVLRVWDSPRPRLPPPPMHFCHNNSEAVVIASQKPSFPPAVWRVAEPLLRVPSAPPRVRRDFTAGPSRICIHHLSQGPR